MSLCVCERGINPQGPSWNRTSSKPLGQKNLGAEGVSPRLRVVRLSRAPQCRRWRLHCLQVSDNFVVCLTGDIVTGFKPVGLNERLETVVGHLFGFGDRK